MTPLPRPAVVLGPVATLTLRPETVTLLSRLVNSLLVGPILVVRHSLPRRDPTGTVLVSSAAGTVFYLVVAVGTLVVVP